MWNRDVSKAHQDHMPFTDKNQRNCANSLPQENNKFSHKAKDSTIDAGYCTITKTKFLFSTSSRSILKVKYRGQSIRIDPS